MPPPTTWFIIKHTETGELSMVNSVIRKHQVMMWAVNCMIIPSIVIKEFENVETATDYLIEMNMINEMIKAILNKKD